MYSSNSKQIFNLSLGSVVFGIVSGLAISAGVAFTFRWMWHNVRAWDSISLFETIISVASFVFVFGLLGGIISGAIHQLVATLAALIGNWLDSALLQPLSVQLQRSSQIVTAIPLIGSWIESYARQYIMSVTAQTHAQMTNQNKRIFSDSMAKYILPLWKHINCIGAIGGGILGIFVGVVGGMPTHIVFFQCIDWFHTLCLHGAFAGLLFNKRDCKHAKPFSTAGSEFTGAC
jgi:hypothetical protein